jgi:hypothetical protein
MYSQFVKELREHVDEATFVKAKIPAFTQLVASILSAFDGSMPVDEDFFPFVVKFTLLPDRAFPWIQDIVDEGSSDKNGSHFVDISMAINRIIDNMFYLAFDVVNAPGKRPGFHTFSHIHKKTKVLHIKKSGERRIVMVWDVYYRKRFKY